jgi:hypothetical protein
METERTTQPEPGTAPALADHAHRWRIGPQDGPTSAGLCACGAEQSFANSYQRSAITYGARRRSTHQAHNA